VSQVPSAAHLGDVGKLTDERPKSSVHGKIPVPSPDLPFYLPPPISKALRWSILLRR